MKFVDRYNAIVGVAVAVLTAMLGVYWYVFVGYLALNAIDYVTGWAKARKLKQECSSVGIVGIAKKVGYWILILENLVEYGINVPVFLIKGLAVTEKLITAGADIEDKE